MTSIQAIGCALPPGELTNEDLDREHPSWQMDLVAELTGIHSRRTAAEDETPFDLSVRACEELFARPDVDVEGIDAIICCIQNPDYRGVANAHLLHERLGLGDNVLALDFALTCSGFVYGLAMADAFTRSGAATKTLLITADTPTKHLNPRDRATRVLFGDAAAATYISADEDRGGRVVASELCTHGSGYRHMYIPSGGARHPAGTPAGGAQAGGSRDAHTDVEMQMDGAALWGFVGSTIPDHIEAFLAKSSLSVDDIDIWVFHQASEMILKTLAKALAIPYEKLFIHMRDVGNLSATSIPFALQAALEQGAIGPGDRVLLSAFGAGISYASAIVEY